MTNNSKKEENYYPLVERFLEKKKDCFVTGTKKGPRTMGAVDVIGVRDIGGYYSPNIEVIVVEVKKALWNFGTIIGQTLGYSIYGHKCYLAVVFKRGEGFTEEHKEIASNFGVGLIEIKPYKKENQCEEVQSSKLFAPMDNYMFSLLEKLKIFKCNICGQFKKKSEFPKGHWINLKPRRIFGSTSKHPYWKYETVCKKCQQTTTIAPADLILNLATHPRLMKEVANLIRDFRKPDVDLSTTNDYITFKINEKPFLVIYFGWANCFYIQIPLGVGIVDPKKVFERTKWNWEVKITEDDIKKIKYIKNVIREAKKQVKEIK